MRIVIIILHRLQFESLPPVFVHSLPSSALHIVESLIFSLHTRALTMFPFLGIYIITTSVVSSALVQREAQTSNIRILPASFILPSPTASTLLAENTQPSISLPVFPTPPFNVSSNVVNLPNISAPALTCDHELGQGLNVPSCVQAYAQLKTWLTGRPRYYVTIGQPGYGVWDINSRIRFLSGEFIRNSYGFWKTDEREAADRVCAFDVWVMPGGEDDRVAVLDLVHASNTLMFYCVASAGGPAAGSYGNIGNLRPLA